MAAFQDMCESSKGKRQRAHMTHRCSCMDVCWGTMEMHSPCASGRNWSSLSQHIRLNTHHWYEVVVMGPDVLLCCCYRATVPAGDVLMMVTAKSKGLR